MPTPSNPPINMGDIYAEFQQPWGTPLSSFLRAPNGVVPNVSQNGNVPQGLPINMLQLLGATRYVPLVVDVSRSGGDDFRTEPAPVQLPVSGSLIATASGGTGNYSYSWAYVGGGTGALSWSTAAGGRTVNATDTVRKNDIVNLVFQLTITDGVSTYQQNHTLRLTYSTDL